MNQSDILRSLPPVSLPPMPTQILPTQVSPATNPSPSENGGPGNAPAQAPSQGNTDLRTTILRVLQGTTSDAPLKTIDIAKRAISEKGVTRKMVNPTLYALKKEGLIEKITDDNETNPRWYVV